MHSPLAHYPLGDVSISPNVIYVVYKYEKHKAKDLGHFDQILLLVEARNLSSYRV